MIHSRTRLVEPLRGSHPKKGWNALSGFKIMTSSSHGWCSSHQAVCTCVYTCIHVRTHLHVHVHVFVVHYVQWGKSLSMRLHFLASLNTCSRTMYIVYFWSNVACNAHWRTCICIYKTHVRIYLPSFWTNCCFHIKCWIFMSTKCTHWRKYTCTCKYMYTFHTTPHITSEL